MEVEAKLGTTEATWPHRKLPSSSFLPKVHLKARKPFLTLSHSSKGISCGRKGGDEDLTRSPLQGQESHTGASVLGEQGP